MNPIQTVRTGLLTGLLLSTLLALPVYGYRHLPWDLRPMSAEDEERFHDRWIPQSDSPDMKASVEDEPLPEVVPDRDCCPQTLGRVERSNFPDGQYGTVSFRCEHHGSGGRYLGWVLLDETLSP